MARRSTPPKYSRHSSGQARVRIDGRVHYLGPHGSPESYSKYAKLIERWRATQPTVEDNISVGQLTLLYLNHCRQHYVKDGRGTSQICVVRSAMRRLNHLYRDLPAADFSPRMLKAVREKLVDDDLARRTVNEYVGVVRQAFRWAVSEELVPATILLGLQSVRDLQAGRSAAREPEPVRPVPDDRIDLLKAHVPPAVWGLIQFQRLTGARPGEALIVRGSDLKMSGDVWEYIPSRHKLEHKGIDRVIMVGPAAQEEIRPFLSTNLEAYLFSPDPGGQRPYRRDSYTNAIKRGCEVAFEMPARLRTIGRYVKRQTELTEDEREQLREELSAEAKEWRREHCWSPNQLRHSFATAARRAAGIEAARVLLGHSSAVTSEIYAERDFEQAREIAAKIG